MHIYDAEKKQYQLPNSVWPRPAPSSVDAKTSDLRFNHDANPFAFWITRRATGEIIFDTRASSIPTYDDLFSQSGTVQNGSAMPAHPLVFEDQYLQLATALTVNTNIYGLGEWIDPNGFARTTNGSLTTMWARDAGDPGRHLQARSQLLSVILRTCPCIIRFIFLSESKHVWGTSGLPIHELEQLFEILLTRSLPSQLPRNGHSHASRCARVPCNRWNARPLLCRRSSSD